MAEVSNESRKRFCEELKIGVVREIEEGVISLREASRECGTSTSQVRVWLEEYGRFRPKRDVVEVVMKSEKEKIAALEKALAEATIKLGAWESLVEVAGEDLGVDLKKSIGDGRLDIDALKTILRSVPSAKRSAKAETRTTKAKGATARKSSGRRS